MAINFRGVEVYYENGNIVDSDVDAICVSTTSNLNLSVGAGKAVRNKVGNTLNTKLEEERRNIINSDLSLRSGRRLVTTTVVIDGGVKLGNKKLLLVIIRRNDHNDLQGVYERIFQRAISEGFESIALPAIGTGGFNIPSTYGAVVAGTALHTISDFGTLKKIYFKDINNDTISKYESRFRHMVNGTEDPNIDEYEDENIGSTAMMQITDEERAKLEDDDKCAVCLYNFHESDEVAVTLKLCRHIFHKVCIQECFKTNSRCPLCLKIYATKIGPQPPGGNMRTTIVNETVPGFPDANGFIKITYFIPSGLQTSAHIRPGLPYSGVTRVAYLPNNREGNRLLKLLELAFKMRLTFTVSDSYTTGRRNICVWNGIHHKTDKKSGPYGYPDPTYLTRLENELRDIGITEELL
uniref:E3 ubiquitin-protein ligase n=1 Tax=Parastrongyloides trichosuri TaxID=131310 RepID=A0A0N4ZQ96_PARTI